MSIMKLFGRKPQQYMKGQEVNSVIVINIQSEIMCVNRPVIVETILSIPLVLNRKLVGFLIWKQLMSEENFVPVDSLDVYEF